MQEMQVWSLGWADPLDKKVATHSSILAWEIPWTEEPGGLWPMGLQKSQTQFSNYTTTTISLCAYLYIYRYRYRYRYRYHIFFLVLFYFGVFSYSIWRDSVTHIYVSVLFQIIFPFRLLQSMEQSSLCYTVWPCWIYILSIVVCTSCQPQTLSLFLLTPFPLVTTNSFSKSVSLFLFCK